MGPVKTARLKFLGAAQEVTGSKTLFGYRDKKYLVDCGLYQGDSELRAFNWQDIPEASQVDAVILTHAHIDHCGYLPRIVKQGFKGPIFCTAATQALVEILLKDAAHLEAEDAEQANHHGHSSHQPALPLFDLEDVSEVLKRLRPVERDVWRDLSPGLSFRFLRSGHLLGSSFVQLSFDDGQNQKVVTFSGDLGSERSEVIKGPVNVLETDYLILESTYGDRVHHKDDIEKTLIRVIKDVHAYRGVLVIPAFAVGRTQEILYLINKLKLEGKIPALPLFLDSPMAIKATEIYKKFKSDLRLQAEDNHFFSSLEDSYFRPVTSASESFALTRKDGSFIVISAAGMLTGGRVLHHLKARLPRRGNIVLFVGFQAHGTKGRLLQNGIDRIEIHHEEVPVNAEIVSLEGLSAHADAREIIDWLHRFSKKPAKIFLNHGEPDAIKALRYRIEREFAGCSVLIPKLGEDFALEEK